jgi:membrane associated rhomboid family serine protease
MKNRVGNIGHSAHLGGAIGGFVFTLLLFPQILRENLLMIIFLSLPILFLLVFGKKLNV